MTTMKTADLEGAALDAAVALAEGWISADEKGDVWIPHNGVATRARIVGGVERGAFAWAPSSFWADGGPIIERERISILICHPGWEAFSTKDTSPRLKDAAGSYGPTPLIAAMRAYVCAKLGEEIELP